MYVDPVWFAWGQATSIEFLPDVVLEHHALHGRAGPVGRVLRSLDGPDPSDCTAYNDTAKIKGMNADIEKLDGDSVQGGGYG